MKASGCFAIGCGSVLVIFLLSAIVSNEFSSIFFWGLALILFVGLVRFFHKRSVLNQNKSKTDIGIQSSRFESPVKVSIDYEDVYDEYDVDEGRLPEVQWQGPEHNVKIAGRNIGGMIYVGDSSIRANQYLYSGGGIFVDPKLEVARKSRDVKGETLPYWPDYNHASPVSRATYLDWLASGRSDSEYSPGYVFLYFYGLEYRFFQDSPSKEEQILLKSEVERLLGIYGDSHSVRRYLSSFIEAAHIVLGSYEVTEPSFEKTSYELSLCLCFSIGTMIKHGQPLNADWLLSWYIEHPTTSLRTPARRAFKEFRTLYTLLFNKRYPDGLIVKVPKRELQAVYNSASNMFSKDLAKYLGEVPDISGLTRPINIAGKFVDEATDSLDKYSRYLGRNPEGRESIKAHALLPKELWTMFPSGEMEALYQWATGVIKQGGLCQVEHVVEHLEGVVPDKLPRSQLIEISDALARLSIGLAPDPRFALRSPKLGEPVVLFKFPEGVNELEEVSNDYKSTLFMIAIGSFIAHADGSINELERKSLTTRVDNAQISEMERARLHANIQWMLAVPPNLNLFRRRIKDVAESVRHELGQMALAMVTVDGSIDPVEIKAIGKLYKAMGLSDESVYSDLHNLSANSEPVTVRPAGQSSPGFVIPSPPDSSADFTLDSKRVASVMANTERVSSILGEIFAEEAPDEKSNSETLQDENDSRYRGLDERHAAFLTELISRSHWEKNEFELLASQFKLMHSGALETINDWSFENYNDVLIEEYEGYELNPEIVSNLRLEG